MSRSELKTQDERLEAAMESLGDLEDEFEKAIKDAYDDEAEHKVAFAVAFKKSNGTNADARKADATVETKESLKKHFKSSAVREFMKERMKNAQLAVEVRRSLLSADVRTNRAVG
jgi:hypothetical protein